MVLPAWIRRLLTVLLALAVAPSIGGPSQAAAGVGMASPASAPSASEAEAVAEHVAEEAYDLAGKEHVPEDLEEMLRRDPTLVLEMLTKLRSRILKPLENNKRGIDFGLGRGYSGNQAAKHIMGLVASNYAGGPGRKRKRAGQGQAAWRRPQHQLSRQNFYYNH